MKLLTMAVLLAVGSHGAVGGVDQDHRMLIHPTLISLSCSPRKTCSKTIASCQEAYWFMENCSWGGKLDGDNDGVPCENMCPGG